MKKRIFAACTILIAACCSLAGCSLSGDGGQDEEDKCAHLDEMALAHYSEIELSITTDSDMGTLESVYTFSYGGVITVSYTVEEFAPLSSDEDIERKRGTATISGESVTVEGDNIGISADSAKLPFSFREAYFENAVFGGNFFTADVKDVAGFMGIAGSFSNMKTEAKFGTVLTSLTVTYDGASGEHVRAEYTFTK